ncbi:hypothetical protein YC2023_099154 [Brassica napus]
MFGLIHYLKNRCVIQGKRLNEQKNNNVNDQPKGDQSCIDLDKLQNEFVFTTAKYMLSLKNSRWTYSGKLLCGQNICFLSYFPSWYVLSLQYAGS